MKNQKNVYLDNKNHVIPKVGHNKEVEERMAALLKAQALSGLREPPSKNDLMSDFETRTEGK